MIDKNQQALLELLKASLFGAEPVFPEGVDWDAVLQEAKDQTVVALAAPAVPEEEAVKWQVPAAQNKMRFFQVLDEQTKLVQLFHDAGIPMVILKGFAAAIYYPVPLQRTMGDVDFIIPQNRFDDARRLMDENGYIFTHKTDRHHGYIKNNQSLELHYRYSEENWDFEHLIAEGLTRASSAEIYGKDFSVLPVEINGLVLLDHIRSHLYGGLGIRQIVDWMLFVHAYLDDAAWAEQFASLAREPGLETLALTVTKMCKLWFGLPDEITWCDDADEETAEQLMELVFGFGNFGIKRKDEGQPMDSISMDVSRYGLFRYLQMTGESTWKAYQKHHFLKPFAWLYQIFRFAKSGLVALFRGEKDKVDTSQAKEKYALYQKLGINFYQNSSSEKIE